MNLFPYNYIVGDNCLCNYGKMHMYCMRIKCALWMFATGKNW